MSAPDFSGLYTMRNAHKIFKVFNINFKCVCIYVYVANAYEMQTIKI